MSTKNPNWHRDELVLALDLYFTNHPSGVSQSSKVVFDLSSILQKMDIHKDKPKDSSFRSPNSVYMKLCNFMRLDPDCDGEGLTRGNKLEEEVWKTYANDKSSLAKEAQRIKGMIP